MIKLRQIYTYIFLNKNEEMEFLLENEHLAHSKCTPLIYFLIIKKDIINRLTRP